MTTPPIPPYTLVNFNAALGDVIRAAAVWGAAVESKSDTDATAQQLMQFLAQLLAVVYQREPTGDEIMAVANMLHSGG